MKKNRAISLWEPWASLVATGAKTVETRSWHTEVRGELLICAAMKKDKDSIKRIWTPKYQEGLEPLIRNTPYRLAAEKHLNFGKAVAVVELKYCIGTYTFKQWPEFKEQEPFGDFSPNRYAWVFHNIRRIKEPYPVKGKQGFFFVEMPEGVEFV